MNIVEALIQVRKEIQSWVSENLISKIDKNNPEMTGTFSVNRAADTDIANYSATIGENNEASGEASFGEGVNTKATGKGAHTEGVGTTAEGEASHAGGTNSVAKGINSFVHGKNLIAGGNNQNVLGKFNIEDTEEKYAQIVGNGESEEERTNAYTLDWKGNAWYAGDVYVGGTRQGDASKLAKESEVALKVNKEDGKGLSSNDFTTAEKEKLAGLPTSIDYPVDSVNGKTGAVTLTASDVGALPSTTVIPSTEGFATEDYVDNAVANAEYTLPTATSSTVGGIKVGNGLKISSSVLSVDVVDNLTSTSTTKALSAAQGKALSDAINSITGDIGELGGGDMMKATYDKDGDGIVDNSEQLEGHAASYFATATDLDALGDLVGTTDVPTQIRNAINGISHPVSSVNGKTGTVTLTASDVGALPSSTVVPDAYTLPTASSTVKGGIKIGSGLSISNEILSANVTSVNGKTGAVELSASDVGAATESFVTTKIAEASLSGGDVDLSGYATKDELADKVDKVSGMGLSSNDFSALHKASIESFDSLERSRGIIVDLESTSEGSFNYANDITPGIRGTLGIANGGTGATTAEGILQNCGVSASAEELNQTAGVVDNIQSQINAVSTMGVSMTKLNATGSLTDSNTVNISNATDYDLFVIYLNISDTNNSVSSMIIPRTMITTSAGTAWTIANAAHSKTFTAHFSGTSLILSSIGYTGSGCTDDTPSVYGISMSILAEDNNSSTGADLGTKVATLTVADSAWSTNVTGSWQSTSTSLWSGNPSQNNYSYFSRLKLTSPSSVASHNKLVVAVELKQKSYASKCMAVLSKSELDSTAVQNSTYTGASTTLTNAAVGTCDSAKYADGTSYADGWIAAGNTVYFIFSGVNITANTTYYVYLLPKANNSNSWFESERSLVSAAVY